MCDFGFENGTNIVFVWQVISNSECTFGGAIEGLDSGVLQDIWNWFNMDDGRNA